MQLGRTSHDSVARECAQESTVKSSAPQSISAAASHRLTVSCEILSFGPTMTDPAEYPPDTPTVTLAGKTWPIPELAIRQLRLVRRPLIDLTDAIAATESETTGERVMRLSTAQYEAMVDIVYQGLTRAHPKLAREDFLDLPASDMEIFQAFLVVRSQSGLFVTAPQTEARPPGEAAAEL